MEAGRQSPQNEFVITAIWSQSLGTKASLRTRSEAIIKTILSLFLGIAFIVAGTALLTYQGITFTTAERQLLQVGPLQAATQQSNWTITLPPILGAILLAGGTIIVFVIAMVKRGPKQVPTDRAVSPGVGVTETVPVGARQRHEF
jgi:hypothetical protein